MKSVLFHRALLCGTGFVDLRVSMLDRTANDASALAAPLVETRIGASEVLVPFKQRTGTS
jgi:hypothetical protein